jgi:CRISPR/Cas system-associated protein Csm6
MKGSREGNRIKAELNRMARRVARMEAQKIEIDDIEYFIDVQENIIGRIV